ncbi:uncharacterized protein C18orf19 homolog A isoform X2 [Anabrus simplex]|uniref:uncharacterized protein C18orf19 homolog A isoform X2 n=1 Tax=Anabrus simplex TaxID=316456 RepID=UPI0035A379CB
MSFTILRSRVLAPPSATLWRWCTISRHGCICSYRDKYFGQTLSNSSKNGTFSLVGGPGDLWKNNVANKAVVRRYSINDKKDPEDKAKVSGVSDQPQNEVKKVGLVQKFKQMYRDYWYVLVPVHLVTSIGWFGGFYYLAKSGVDVVALLESMGVSERFIDPLKDSKAGYIALAYALYKIATPIRYTVTLGGTTLSIKYLEGHGYIKPIPPKEKLKEMYQEKKDNLMERRDNLAVEFRQTKERFKERRQTFMDDYRKRAKKSDISDK